MRQWISLLLCIGGVAQATPLSLERAVELARTRNERALGADALAEAAQGRLAQARAFFFPTVTTTGALNRRAYEVTRELNGVQVPILQRNALNANATLRWTLFDARGIPLYRAAAADARAAALEAKEAQRRLGFEAAEAFLQTLTLDAVEEAARRRVALADRNQAEATARQAAGLASTNDVTRAELEAATARRELARAEGNRRTARLQLAFLLDAEASEVEALKVPGQLVEQAATAGPEQARAQDDARLTARLDLQALRARAEQQSHLAQEPWLRLVPAIGLNAQVRATNEVGISGLPVDGFIGVDLTWVLYDGGARYAVGRERAATSRLAALNERLGGRSARLEVEAALVALATARASAAQAGTADRVARRNAEETSALYREGLTTGLQLADASVQQFEAEVALASERFGVVMALLDLRAALGVDALGREVTP